MRKLEKTPSRFFPVSENWGELGIKNLARMCLMKSYWMLQNDLKMSMIKESCSLIKWDHFCL